MYTRTNDYVSEINLISQTFFSSFLVGSLGASAFSRPVSVSQNARARSVLIWQQQGKKKTNGVPPQKKP